MRFPGVRHSPRPRSNKTGFTLLDLVLALAILSAIAVLVIPAAGSANRQILASATELMIADLYYARAQSMGNGADPCAVVFGPDTSRYHLAHHSDLSTPIVDPGSGHSYITNFGRGRAGSLHGVSLDPVQVGNDSVLSYGSFGDLDEVIDARITLNRGADSVVIRVDLMTGEPFVED